MSSKQLLSSKLQLVNIGLDSFAQDLAAQNINVVHVDWQPPAGGKTELNQRLLRVARNQDWIDKANEQAVERLITSHPKLIDVGLAKDVIPNMTSTTILHAGPPIQWEKMCGPMRGAIIGALIYEGLAKDEETAEKRIQNGEILFSPCHEYGAVGPMAGIISASMPVFIIQNEAYGNRAFTNMNEGLGKVLRFGANSEEVIRRLTWIKDVLAPALSRALKHAGSIDLKSITARALQMGDECHNRNMAATSLFTRMLLPAIIRTSESSIAADVADFFAANDHFYLNLSMAACKASLDAANGIEGSTLVTAMARNGVEFGIRVSGLREKWFTAPAPLVKGLYFAGYGDSDANPDLGDSAITETFGIGGFAMAAAPAIVQFVGGNTDDALGYTKEMYGITLATNQSLTMPSVDFRPIPTGIDIVKVVETGTQPIINTGIAHKLAGVGQVGAGIVRAPLTCFEQALICFADTLR